MLVYFHSFGCRLNFSETDVISGILRKKGHGIADTVENAELCVINTCTVTERSNVKCRQLIRGIQRKNPTAKIAVVGCYSQMSSEEIAEIGGVHLILGTAEKLYLANYIDQLKTAEEPIIRTGKIPKKDFTIDYTEHRKLTRSNLKIQDGCDFFCSFCIIPFSRGRSRSRVFDDIAAEATQLGASGYKEIVLTGVNVGTYQYQKYTIVDVIEALEKTAGIERIRISSIEPTTVPDELLVRMNDPSSKLVPYLHLPLQSANNTVLRDMRRKYTIEEYGDFIEKAYGTVKNICIGTDILTGYPTETRERFEDTHEKLSTLPIHYFHVFPYSERSGTRSALQVEKNTAADIQRRAFRLRNLSDKKRIEYNRTFIGKTMPVLFEGEKHPNYWQGYTSNYIRVVGYSEKKIKGSVVHCTIESVSDAQTTVQLA